MKMTKSHGEDRRDEGAARDVDEVTQPGMCSSAAGVGTSEGAPPREAARSVQPAGSGHVVETPVPNNTNTSCGERSGEGDGRAPWEESDVISPVAQSAKVEALEIGCYYLKREGDSDTVVQIRMRDGEWVYLTMSSLVQSVASVPAAKFAKLERVPSDMVKGPGLFFCVLGAFQGPVQVDTARVVMFPSGERRLMGAVAAEAKFFAVVGGIGGPLNDFVPESAWIRARDIPGYGLAMKGGVA
jgi:hypothetical protein